MLTFELLKNARHHSVGSKISNELVLVAEYGGECSFLGKVAVARGYKYRNFMKFNEIMKPVMEKELFEGGKVITKLVAVWSR